MSMEMMQRQVEFSRPHKLKGRKILLTGRTQKGKNAAQRDGNEWRIVQVTDTVRFDTRQGPWLLITTGGDTDRWVHQTDDVNFTVEEL